MLPINTREAAEAVAQGALGYVMGGGIASQLTWHEHWRIVCLPNSGHSKICMGTDVWRLEGEHDMIAGNTRFDTLFGYAVLRPIVLNPHFLLTDVNVQHTAVNAIGTVPARVHQFVMIVSLIKDHFNLHLTARRLVLGIALNEFPNNVPVVIYCCS